MDLIDRQIKVLEEKKKRMEEERKIGEGRPRIISDVQIISPRGVAREGRGQEQLQAEAWKEVVNKRRG